ncbi:MAG: DivIVA domain-containing protein, partial [Actinomycetota bacterium]|nr:DivIVA domain-containing protein [Actinomycetota bacterium]
MTDDEGARTLGPVEEAAEELARAWVRTAHEASVRLRQQAQREADAIVADAKRILAAAEAQVARLHAYAAEVTDGLAGLTRRPEEPAAWDPLGLRVEDAPCQGEGRSAPGAGPAPSVAPVPGAGAPAGERNGAPAAPVVSVNGHTTPAFRVVPSAADVDVEPAPVPAGEVASAYVPLLGSRGRHLPS